VNAPVFVRDLAKSYRVHEREEGLGAAMRALVKRRYRDVRAVDGITFEIGEGEVVGFLGPNGAGKTTTLKMLAGLLYPTSGEATVLGHTPWLRESRFLTQITLLMGNRSQLVWDIPAADSFRVLQQIYEIGESDYRVRLDELSDLLDLGPLLHKPVRQLSLGERMKVEFAASLVHAPRVIFLDEPTIGLDVTAQTRIRRFVADYNRRTGATILLTSHYMDDVVALCRRVLVIHHGKLLYDGGLADLATRMAPYKLVVVTLADGASPRFDEFGEVVASEEGRTTVRVPRESAAERTAAIIRAFEQQVVDLSVEDPPIEEVIDRVFSGERPLSQVRS